MIKLRALLQGFASVFGQSDRRAVEILARSDAEAIASDWQAVGDDMYRAIQTLKERCD